MSDLDGLSEWIGKLLGELVERDVAMPIFITGVAANGALIQTRHWDAGLGGLETEVLHSPTGYMELPVNLMFTTRTGEEFRAVIQPGERPYFLN